MGKRGKDRGSGRYSARARAGNVNLRLSGKTSTISVYRTDAEQARLLASIKAWRAAAPDEFRGKARELMQTLEPYSAISILGNVYYAQNASDPETYAEWSHEGLPAKVEHVALLLAARPTDGRESLVPPDVAMKISAYLEDVFSSLLMYYDDAEETRHPLDPDPRSLVLMDELFVRMPVYPRQHRDTLRALFDSVGDHMERALGFRIDDAIALDEAFEGIAMDAGQNVFEPLRAAMRQALPFTRRTADGGTLDFRGDEEAAVRIRGDIRRARATAMSAFGANLAVDSKSAAVRAGIDEARADAVLRFFETTTADLEPDYFIPAPDGPLMRKPFLRFAGRWVLPDLMLFLPAMQPALERALNPAHGAPTAIPAVWNRYVANRAESLERWTAEALSTLLDGAPVERNLKYKSVAGSKAHDELDAMAFVDGKMFLVECKAGGFTATARRGDLQAIEGRIAKLMTESHEQALRARSYLRSRPDPTFRAGGGAVVVDAAQVEEILLLTTTLEDLGHLTARFNDVARVSTSAVGGTPWIVSIHDLQLIAKYTPNAPTFVHYLKRRLGLNAQPAFDAMSELDWYGRYLHDALNLTEFRREVASGAVMTANLLSHTTVFDDFELYETGRRKTLAPRPAPAIHPIIASVVQALADWKGRGYVDAGCMLLDLPPKLQRGFAKRISAAAKRVARAAIAQEVARTDDGDVAVACSICGPDVRAEVVVDPAGYGAARRNAHLVMRATLEVVAVRTAFA